MPEPRNAKDLLEEARAAHRAKLWPEAERLWRAYVALAPKQPTGHINLGLALFALGRFEEAADSAQIVRSRWPERVEGAVLAARTASVGADAPTRVVVWRAVAKQFPDSVAASSEYGRALLQSGAAVDADTQAERLLKLDRRLGLHLKGRAIDAIQRETDLTDFWRGAVREFPDDIDFRRKAIQAALWAGRTCDAETEFEALLVSGRGRLADVNFTIGLANLHRAAGDRGRLRAVVRSYFHALAADPGYRLAAVKLSRVVLGDFSRAPVDATTVPGRFETMVRRSPASHAVKAWLRDLDGLYAEVLQSSPRSLLETDVSRDQCKTFVAAIRTKLQQGSAFSLVRLGDGESNAVGYEPYLRQFLSEDADVRERMWWGKTLTADDRRRLDDRVREAISNADMLGIPCAGRAIRDLDLKADTVLEGGNTGRGIRAVLHFARGLLAAEKPPMFVSAHVHQDLYKHGLYDALFRDLDGVVSVSPHATLPEVLKAKFGVVSATNVTLRAAWRAPTRAALAYEKDASRSGDAAPSGFVLPDQLDSAIAALPSDLRRRLVIIAGGYAGKWIGEAARQRGGVALDLGSIADYWMGVRSRGYLDLA